MFPPPHKTTRSPQTVPTDLACRPAIRDAKSRLKLPTHGSWRLSHLRQSWVCAVLTYARSHQLYVGKSSESHRPPPQPAAQEKEQPLRDVTSPQFPADLWSHTPEPSRLTASCLLLLGLALPALWLLAAPSILLFAARGRRAVGACHMGQIQSTTLEPLLPTGGSSRQGWP